MKLLLGRVNPDPGVKTEMAAASLQAMEDARAGRIRVRSGTAPMPWFRVETEAGEVPEVTTPGGGRQLSRCETVVFLVDGPEGGETRRVFHAIPPDRAAREAPRPLKSSASERLTLKTVDVAGRPVFAAPGTYGIRAVAGRLVSNPVTVVVEGAVPKPAPAGPANNDDAVRGLLATCAELRKRAGTAIERGRPEEAFKPCREMRKQAAFLRALGRAADAARVEGDARKLQEVAEKLLSAGKRPPAPGPEAF